MPAESESFPGPSNTTLGNGNHQSISTLSLQDKGDYMGYTLESIRFLRKGPYVLHPNNDSAI